jgi:alanine dehydrogenase
MSALHIRENDVAALVTIHDAISALDECFAQWPAVRDQNVARQRIKMPNGMFNLLGAGYGPKQVYGVKAYFASPAGARFQILLYSAVSGEMLAVVEADLLSRLRTGAASGLATKALARPEARSLALIGTGQQALTQALAIAAVRPLKRISVFSRNEDNRRRFAQLVTEQTGVAAEAANSAQACVEGADIVTTITKSATPVCLGAWLAAGAHVNAAGANAATRRELDDAAVLRAAILATDSREQAKQEAGEFIELAKSGAIGWERVQELGDVICGAAPGRTSSDQITLFKSLGVGIEDIAFAELVYRKARAAGVGKTLDI